MLTDEVQEMAEHVARLMKEHLSVSGSDLNAKLRRAGRLLPKGVKREAQFLAEACEIARNPKLVKMVDAEKVRIAHDTCVKFLETVNAKDRRKGLFLGMLGSIAISLIVVFMLVVVVLVWRDLV